MKNILRFATIVSLTAALAGCGGGGGDNPVAPSTPSSNNPAPRAVVTTSDFTSGAVSAVGRTDPRAANNNLLALASADAAVRVLDDAAYVLQRFGVDSVLKLDPSDLSKTLWETSVKSGDGDYPNPQDIAATTGGKALVTLLQRDEIMILDLETGEKTGSVDISAFADADGSPECSRIVRAGDRLYAFCQLLDENQTFWPPTGPGIAIVIDAATNIIMDMDAGTPGVQALQLTVVNPIDAEYDAARGLLFVAGSGTFGVEDAGGIEVIDVPTGALVPSRRVTEAALGGDATSVAVASATKAYAVVSDATWTNKVKAFNPQTGAVSSTGDLSGFTSSFIADIGVDPEGQLWVPDRNAPGMRVYDTGDDSLAQAVIDVGLPPYYVDFLE